MSFPKFQELFNEKDGLHQQSPPLGNLGDRWFCDEIWHTSSWGWYRGPRVWPMQSENWFWTLVLLLVHLMTLGKLGTSPGPLVKWHNNSSSLMALWWRLVEIMTACKMLNVVPAHSDNPANTSSPSSSSKSWRRMLRHEVTPPTAFKV